MADAPPKKEVTLEMFMTMSDEDKAQLSKKARKKLEKRAAAAIRKKANAEKEAARLKAAAELRAKKAKAAEGENAERQIELDKLREERLAIPVFDDLKHGYVQRWLPVSLRAIDCVL